MDPAQHPGYRVLAKSLFKYLRARRAESKDGREFQRLQNSYLVVPDRIAQHRRLAQHRQDAYREFRSLWDAGVATQSEREAQNRARLEAKHAEREARKAEPTRHGRSKRTRGLTTADRSRTPGNGPSQPRPPAPPPDRSRSQSPIPQPTSAATQSASQPQSPSQPPAIETYSFGTHRLPDDALPSGIRDRKPQDRPKRRDIEFPSDFVRKLRALDLKAANQPHTSKEIKTLIAEIRAGDPPLPSAGHDPIVPDPRGLPPGIEPRGLNRDFGQA